MICLDTNYLIRGVAEGSAEAAELVAWIEAGETLITPMPAWFEFICGPVTLDQTTTMRAFLHSMLGVRRFLGHNNDSGRLKFHPPYELRWRARLDEHEPVGGEELEIGSILGGKTGLGGDRGSGNHGIHLQRESSPMNHCRHTIIHTITFSGVETNEEQSASARSETCNLRGNIRN